MDRTYPGQCPGHVQDIEIFLGYCPVPALNQGINWKEYGENTQEKLMLDLMWEAGRFFNREEAPKESYLVDFPEFCEGNQDPIEWLESFDRACSANRVNEAQKLILAGSYLKGTALTWYNQHHLDTGTIHNTSPYPLFISSKTNLQSI